MIKMSDDFNNSIASTEREIKGYVEVTYTNFDYKSNTTLSNYPASLKINNEFIDVNQILDDDRKGKNYASLEKDYFQLNGTFVLPNNKADKNPGIGYVSENTFENDEQIPILPFTLTSKTQENNNISGLTLYFQNNKPLGLEIEITNSDGTSVETFNQNDCNISDNGTVQLMFSERPLNFVKIYVKDVLYPNRRIRLQEVDFGLSVIYEGEELISFKTIEQINRFSYDMPINECQVVLGDYNGKFDAINPKGIVKYLTNDVIIKPYVGVVTKESGIEYCKLGHFWLDNYTLSNGRVTFTCKDIFNKLQDNDFYITRGRGFAVWLILSNLSTDWGITINNLVGNNYDDYIHYYADMKMKKISSKIDTLQKIATICGNIFTSNRNGEIKYIKSKNTEIQGYKISNNRLIEFEDIKIQEPIKNYKYTSYMVFDVDESSNEYDGVQERYDETRQCNGLTTMYFQDENYCYQNFKCYLICDDYNSLEVIDSNCYVVNENEDVLYNDTENYATPYMFVKFKYNGKVQCKISGSKFRRITKADNVINCNVTGNDISINNDLYTGWKYNSQMPTINFSYQNIANYILQNSSKYKSTFKFNGDPTIECGDCREIENKYPDENGKARYDKVFITKIESEFKGSFNQSIEGDIIE